VESSSFPIPLPNTSSTLFCLSLPLRSSDSILATLPLIKWRRLSLNSISSHLFQHMVPLISYRQPTIESDREFSETFSILFLCARGPYFFLNEDSTNIAFSFRVQKAIGLHLPKYLFVSNPLKPSSPASSIDRLTLPLRKSGS